jgi:hypothetical protein
MPGWVRRLRIMIDWTFALLFRPDIVKISLDSEAALILREEADDKASEIGAGSATVPAAPAARGPGPQAENHPLAQERI